MSMCPSVRSPVDEEGVHDSFNQLIAEQSQSDGLPDALELQQLQTDLDDEGRGTLRLRAHSCMSACGGLNFYYVNVILIV